MSQQETSKTIYFDNAASQSNPEFNVADNFANPNATHDAGRKAFEVMEKSRETIAKIVGAKRPSEIVWTSSATEANNLAILGMAQAILDDSTKKNKRKVIVFEIEHESCLEPAKSLDKLDFDVVVLPSDRNGFAKILNFMEICDDKTALVIVQHANTEIASIQNVKQIATIAHENGALFHCDCVGSFCNAKLDVENLEMDTASFSGHKIGAPKGIGALYVKNGTPIKPIMHGGHQENGLRPGTQPVALIESFAKAAQHASEASLKNRDNFSEYVSYIATEIHKMDGVRLVVGFPENKMGYLWNIMPLAFENISTQDLILQYGKKGIVIAGGPACSSESNEPSHVLKAIGLSDKEASNVIRLSFSERTTMDDINTFLKVTKEILSEN